MKHDRRNTEERLRLRLYGGVQGVGFRYFVRQAARPLDLAGYVLNRADGSVELEVAGPPAALRDFRHTVENGPPQASVRRVEQLEPTQETLPAPFQIRH